MKYSSPVNKLLTYGDCRDFKKWPNYLKLGFTQEHVPELIKMATDIELNLSDSESVEVWAPTHAWRALAQLKAEEAIEPLMNLFHELEDDEWADEELPTVFALIGPSTLPSLARYLADTSRNKSSRIAAASCLNEVGIVNDEVKENCIDLLSVQLEEFENNPPELNGFLIWFLADYEAVETLPIIKEAYERESVDLSIVGDLSMVEYELGLREEPPQVQLFADESLDDSNDQFSKTVQENFKIGRNDPCPCGSGKKYKKCCLNKI